jgi:rhodanese-related sulfurtransferase
MISEQETTMSDLRIDPQAARSIENALFVDARNPQAWGEATTKIPGAIRIPANDLDSHLAELPDDRPIITYCT